MIARSLLVLSLLPLSALAQIQVFQFDGSTEVPAGSVAVSTTTCDSIEIRLGIRNVGPGAAALSTLSLAGTGFKFSAVPSLPYTIAPGSTLDFRAAFTPAFAGSYSAFLQVNTISVILRGTGIPSACVTLAGGSTPLLSGAVVDFGSLVRGGSRTQTFTLSNPGAAAIAVNVLSVGGTGFRGPIGASAPIALAAGASASFQVAFEPQSGQPAKGTLLVDQRSFTLTGLGLDPPLPTASLVFGSQTGVSAQQNSISIPLASASAVSGTGTLVMDFHSSVTGVSNDPAILFVSGPKRTATVTVSVGDTVAKFGGQPSMGFQMGTTAGTIVFTLTLPNATQQASLTVAQASANFATATGVRRVNDLDVSLTGFDNTYSASQLAFTFYDKAGATMQPGTIRVDASADFRLYFAASQVGGAFALLATFPVSGDATQVGGVDVQLTNSAGVAKTQRIAF